MAYQVPASAGSPNQALPNSYNRTGGTAVPGNTINAYVDNQGSNGSDSNDGLFAVQVPGTTNGPLKNVGAIYEKFPNRAFAGCKIIVNLIGPTSGAAQLYNDIRTIYLDGGDNLIFPFRFRGGTIVGGVFVAGMILYVPTTGPATAALDVVPSTVLQLPNASGVLTNLRTQLNFTAAAPGWTVDDFAARGFVRVTRAGTMRYFELPIARNTANTLIVDTLGIDGDILATDTVEIVRPAVDWRGPSNADTNNVATLSVMGNSGPGLTPGGFGKDGGATFERITFGGNWASKGPLALCFDRCALSGQNSLYFVDNMTLVNCALQRGGINVIVTKFARFPGNSRPDSPTVPTLQAVTSPAVSVAGFNSMMQIGVNGNVASEFITLNQGVMAFSYPVGMWQSRPRVAAETRLGSAISLAGGASMLIMQNGVALLGDTDTTFVTAATLPAIRARMGAQVKIDPAVTAITGKGGVDFQLETGVAIALGAGAGQFMEANGINGNFVNNTPVVVKKTITQAAADTVADITTATGGGPPIKNLRTLRVTAGAAAFVGSYMLTDVGGTPTSPVASTVLGIATISDDGKTITFPAGTQATAITVEYTPVPSSGDHSRIFTSFPA